VVRDTHRLAIVGILFAVAIVAPTMFGLSIVSDNAHYIVFDETSGVKRETADLGAMAFLFGSLLLPAITIAGLLSVVVLRLGRTPR
jgi:hypothetical protein